MLNTTHCRRLACYTYSEPRKRPTVHSIFQAMSYLSHAPYVANNLTLGLAAARGISPLLTTHVPRWLSQTVKQPKLWHRRHSFWISLQANSLSLLVLRVHVRGVNCRDRIFMYTFHVGSRHALLLVLDAGRAKLTKEKSTPDYQIQITLKRLLTLRMQTLWSGRGIER